MPNGVAMDDGYVKGGASGGIPVSKMRMREIARRMPLPIHSEESIQLAPSGVALKTVRILAKQLAGG